MDDEDELLDLVDEHDEVIGTVMRNSTSDLEEGYLRASELFIRSDVGKLWIPRRHLAKRIAPGGLDYSSAGHAGSGEDYIQALVRETKEELNLELDKSRLTLLKKFPPTGGLRYFRSVYIYKSNEAPKYNTNDFTEYYWLSPKELLEKLKGGEPAKKSLKETVEYVINRGTMEA